MLRTTARPCTRILDRTVDLETLRYVVQMIKGVLDFFSVLEQFIIHTHSLSLNCFLICEIQIIPSVTIFKVNEVKGKCLQRVTGVCKLIKEYNFNYVYMRDDCGFEKGCKGIQKKKQQQISSSQTSVFQVYQLGFICQENVKYFMMVYSSYSFCFSNHYLFQLLYIKSQTHTFSISTRHLFDLTPCVPDRCQ